MASGAARRRRVARSRYVGSSWRLSRAFVVDAVPGGFEGRHGGGCHDAGDSGITCERRDSGSAVAATARTLRPMVVGPIARAAMLGGCIEGSGVDVRHSVSVIVGIAIVVTRHAGSRVHRREPRHGRAVKHKGREGHEHQARDPTSRMCPRTVQGLPLERKRHDAAGSVQACGLRRTGALAHCPRRLRKPSPYGKVKWPFSLHEGRLRAFVWSSRI